MNSLKRGIHVEAVVFFLFLLLAGCSNHGDRPELGHVEGTITLDGKPLGGGAAVIFMPQPGRASRGKTDSNGHYVLTYIRDIQGAKVGTHKVQITTYGESEPRELVPAKYNTETTLTEKVKPGEQIIDFELVSM